jgi:hypothetical protein
MWQRQVHLMQVAWVQRVWLSARPDLGWEGQDEGPGQ